MRPQRGASHARHVDQVSPAAVARPAAAEGKEKGVHRADPYATRPSPRRPGAWIGNYRIHPLAVISIVLGIAILLAIVWPK